MVAPEDTFTVSATVGTTEVILLPVPETKSEAKIYVMVISAPGVDNTVTFKVYKGDVLEGSFTIPMPANATIGMLQPTDSPIVSIPSGRTLKVVAAAPSVSILISAYYL